MDKFMHVRNQAELAYCSSKPPYLLLLLWLLFLPSRDVIKKERSLGIGKRGQPYLNVSYLCPCIPHTPLCDTPKTTEDSPPPPSNSPIQTEGHPPPLDYIQVIFSLGTFLLSSPLINPRHTPLTSFSFTVYYPSSFSLRKKGNPLLPILVKYADKKKKKIYRSTVIFTSREFCVCFSTG